MNMGRAKIRIFLQVIYFEIIYNGYRERKKLIKRKETKLNIMKKSYICISCECQPGLYNKKITRKKHNKLRNRFTIKNGFYFYERKYHRFVLLWVNQLQSRFVTYIAVNTLFLIVLESFEVSFEASAALMTHLLQSTRHFQY